MTSRECRRRPAQGFPRQAPQATARPRTAASSPRATAPASPRPRGSQPHNQAMNASNGNPPGGTGVLAGRPVARLGYGAMQLSGPGGLTAPPRQTAISVLRRAAELGVNHIDTAHFYGAGLANELIRAALSPYPDSLVLVSKVGAEEDAQGRLRPAQRPEQLRAGVEADLRSLDVDRVDVVNR